MNNPKHKVVPVERLEEIVSLKDQTLFGCGDEDCDFFPNCPDAEKRAHELGANKAFRQAASLAEAILKSPHPPSNTEAAEAFDRMMGYPKFPSPTQPQSSLHELVDKWREDRKGYCDVGTRQIYECLADELQAALAAESELRGLERDVATDGAITLLATNSLELDDGWLRLDGPVAHHPHMKDTPEVRYLELRGLLERHPTNETLVRLKEDG